MERENGPRERGIVVGGGGGAGRVGRRVAAERVGWGVARTRRGRWWMRGRGER